MEFCRNKTIVFFYMKIGNSDSFYLPARILSHYHGMDHAKLNSFNTRQQNTTQQKHSKTKQMFSSISEINTSQHNIDTDGTDLDS